MSTRGATSTPDLTNTRGTVSTRNRRVIAGLCAIAAILFAGTGYVTWTITRSGRPAAASGLAPAPAGPGTLVFLDRGRTLAQVPVKDPAAEPVRRPLSCLRTYTAGDTTVCLRPVAVPAGFEAAVLRDGREIAEPIRIDGTPSRARVSPSGRLVAWTVFRTGDSYAPGAFATTTGIYDTKTQRLYGSLEDFPVTVDGKPYQKADMNFWGVTFAGDDQTFYATMSSAGHIWLLRGELTTRRLTAVRTDVECPSLSPDGLRIAYKKRLGQRWRLHVLELGSGRETPLAERAEVDDQAAWLDDTSVAYARPDADGRPALFTVPADGTGSPRLLRREATSPAVIR
ncbi:TolB family protein [Streptosporangium sp. NPDC000396]|uniref:TolB family protein n=1 Tax=Streptosporangium sp. NPDC000396 TaxID=3366185 RepID=UPI0036CB408F